MKNALLKDTFREIWRTLSRFLSIFAIVALGVAFFAGVKASATDMRITGDQYFDEYHLMDIRLVSTLGFDDKDVAAIKGVEGIESILPSYTMDAIAALREKETVVKVISLPSSDPNKVNINKTKLIEGRYPENDRECLVEGAKMMDVSVALGTKIRLASGTDKDISESLENSEFTIVGRVETPYYISYDRGTSSVGNGKVNSFIMIPQANFKLPVYTDILIAASGAREEFTYDEEYKDTVTAVKDRLENVAEVREQQRYDEILSEAQSKLQEGRQELADAEKETAEELDKAKDKLESGRKKLDEGARTLQEQIEQFEIRIQSGEGQIASGYRQLEAGESEYKSQLAAYNQSKEEAEEQLQSAEQKLAEAAKQIEQQELELNGAKAMLSGNPLLTVTERQIMEAKIAEGEKQLAIGKAQLAASRAELDSSKNELASAQIKLQQGKATLEATRQQLDSESQKLASSKEKAAAEFASARKKLTASKEALAKGEQEYENAKQEAEEKLADARKELADAENEISKLDKPTWYVLDRNANPGYVDYEFSADRVAAIAQVFPVFFFLIAALVCLTTMTRMVDEQRTYIGTLKALGYSKLAIASKYLLYAALASIGGSITGILIGFELFPTVIFNAYSIMFTMPSVITAFNVYYAVLSTMLAVSITTLAAWFACSQELRSEPSILMRPKAPKIGKRILLERIKPVWARLNFTQKVTARNIFRYKKRFLMTALGIGGCTALLLAGFGLKDSIISIAAIQFDELYKYDMVIQLKEEIDIDEKTSLVETVSTDKRISDYMLIKEQSIDVSSKNTEKSVYLIVPESTNRLEEFIDFRIRGTGNKVPFQKDGVMLTEKLAKQLQVSLGDEIYVKTEGEKKVGVKVLGITEHYVSHYVYMSPALYETVFNKQIAFKQIMAKATDASETFENKLSKDLLKNKEVGSIRFTTGVSKNFKKIITSLNYVVLILIISAGALAFIVLYNLTNVNVTERLREIATIKVLGFYDREVSAYVDRESVLLTLIGMLLGLVLGIFFHRYIIVTAEVEYVMFGRIIGFMSYIYAAVLTMVFSMLVNIVMHFKLKKISMVESLKSVD